MDKSRTMRLNSIRNNNDSYTVKDCYLYSYNKLSNRITLEKFDFTTAVRYVLVNTTNASEMFPEIWAIESTFDQIDFILTRITIEDLISEPIIIY